MPLHPFVSGAVGPLPAALLITLALVCVATDLYKGRIYNAVTYPAIVIGLVVQVALAPSLWSGVGSGLGGLAVGFVPPFVLFLAGGLGGGDVKFLAAVGAIGGAVAASEALLLGFVFGGLFALAKLAWHGRLFRSLARTVGVLGSWVVPGVQSRPLAGAGEAPLTIRFGLSIGLGTLAALFDLRSGVLRAWWS